MSPTPPLFIQVLGESMAGISHNAKNSNLPEFGDSVSAGSKALCGLTEAAAQVTKPAPQWTAGGRLTETNMEHLLKTYIYICLYMLCSSGRLLGGGFRPQQLSGPEGSGGSRSVRQGQPVHSDGLPEPGGPGLHSVSGTSITERSHTESPAGLWGGGVSWKPLQE